MRDGIEELVGAYAKYGLTYDDFTSSRFVRLRRIRELLSAGLVDEMLRRTAGPADGDRPRRRPAEPDGRTLGAHDPCLAGG